MVAGVGAAEDGGGHPVTGGGELGSLALSPPISVGVLTKMKNGNNQSKTKYFRLFMNLPYKLWSMVSSSQNCQNPAE